MKPWKDLTHYAGFDWARDHHAVVIVDAQGKIVADFEFDHSWVTFPDVAGSARRRWIREVKMTISFSEHEIDEMVRSYPLVRKVIESGFDATIVFSDSKNRFPVGLKVDVMVCPGTQAPTPPAGRMN